MTIRRLAVIGFSPQNYEKSDEKLSPNNYIITMNLQNFASWIRGERPIKTLIKSHRINLDWAEINVSEKNRFHHCQPVCLLEEYFGTRSMRRAGTGHRREDAGHERRTAFTAVEEGGGGHGQPAPAPGTFSMSCLTLTRGQRDRNTRRTPQPTGHGEGRGRPALPSGPPPLPASR